VEEEVFSQVLRSLNHLRELSVQIRSDEVGAKIDVIRRIHASCPSVRAIHVQDPTEVQQTVYDWDEQSNSWVLCLGYRDMWAEAVREIDVCVYRPCKVISFAYTCLN
jgi:hypothetical protein